MDEPTNDLDVETLELLEELLLDYKGTLLLVSHDRDFLDNVVTSTLALEGDGKLAEYVGGYSDWLRQRAMPRQDAKATSMDARHRGHDEPKDSATMDARLRGHDEQKPSPPAPAAKKKLSFKEQRELEQLPGRIEQLESDIAALTEAMNAPAFFQQDSSEIVAANEALATLQAELDAAYARWEVLDS